MAGRAFGVALDAAGAALERALRADGVALTGFDFKKGRSGRLLACDTGTVDSTLIAPTWTRLSLLLDRYRSTVLNVDLLEARR